LKIGIAPRRGKPRWLAALGFTVVVGSLLGVGNVALAAPPANNIAVNLDQCRNGGLVTSGTQTVTDCTGGGSGNSGWVNGNAGASNAHYAEGESISYRARLTNLKNNDQVTLILGYDVIHNGHDALDFLTDKNRWQQPEVPAGTHLDDPCSGVTGCTAGSEQLLHITAPPTHIKVDTSKTLANGCQTSNTSDPVQQPTTAYSAVNGAGQENMEFFGATPISFTYVGPPAVTPPNLLDKNGDQEQQVQVVFTANSANPVLAWGAHIASRLDWGCVGAPQSASGISGSPYHMRIKSAIVNGTSISLGNQDRSLSAAAVIFFNPGITTTLEATTGSVGDSIHDGATLTNATASAGGTVTYTVYSDNTCSTAATTGTSGQIDAQPPAVTVTNGIVPNSADVTFQQAGTYYWRAAYSGDQFNAAVTSVCTDEVVVISKHSPSGATTQSLIPNDTLTLSGDVSSDASGNVDFYLFDPDQTCGVTADASAVFHEQVSLSSLTASTSNDGVPANNGYTATKPGLYQWRAVYAGDSKNDGFTSNCVEEFSIDNDNTTP
jgi:hypothetical protein